jgi:hypothetical protein
MPVVAHSAHFDNLNARPEIRAGAMSVSTQAGERAASGLAPTKANRLERLALRLAEAAEIEHGLMCCYLYAAFSLKRDESEGLSFAEVAAVADWRRTIVGILWRRWAIWALSAISSAR